MSLRKINDPVVRAKIVKWIRAGAPLDAGILLYTTLPGHRARLALALQKNPKKFRDELIFDICELLGITRRKFEMVVKEWAGKKPVSPEKKPERKPAPVPANRERSFRNDWPFLSKPECPPELKSLAADKISCWERYTAAHKKLFDCGSLEDCAKVAHEVVSDFKENRLIHDEFHHYAEHGVILGKHRIFGHYQKFKDLRGKNVFDLVKLCEKTLPHKIWRIESEINKNDKPHLRADREKRLKEVKSELAEVKRLLGVE